MRSTHPVHPTTTRAPAPPPAGDKRELRPLVVFAAVALPVGWALLSVPVLLDLPQEPFVLGVLLLGLIAPALVLTARDSGRAGVRALLRDAVRLPHPIGWGAVAALAVPTLVWATAAVLGGAQPLSTTLLVGFVVQLVSGAIIVNIWEEMAWTGFVQRRAAARWGVVLGALVTAVMFAGIHLPLAFDDAGDAGDVAVGVTALLATGIGLRLLIAGVDRWSGRSLLTVGLLHASFNAAADLVDPEYDWVRYAVTVVLGVLVLGVLTRRHTGASYRRAVPAA